MANVKATDLIDFTRASTGTYLDSDGTLKTAANNIPRIEYDADGNLLGLLIEEARTNLITQSEDFGIFWQKVANGTGTIPVVTADYAPAPYSANGRASRLQASKTSGAGYSLLQVAPTGSYTGDSTASIWVKSNTGASQTVYFRAGQVGAVEETVTTEWTRIETTVTLSSGYRYLSIGNRDNTGSEDIDILIWGAQLEAGSFPTSYIKTSGSATSRSADVASIDVDQFGYNQSEGTLFSEFRALGSGLAYSNALTDGTTSNMILQFQETDTSLRTGILSGGSDQTSGMKTATTSAGDSLKFASAFLLNDIAQSLNGATVQTDSSASIPSGILSLRIGDRDDGTRTLNGHIKSLTYTPKRLSNAKLQELTS